MKLDTPLANIKGVGAKTAESLAKAELHTVKDLIEFFPRGYEDYSKVTNIAEVASGKVSLKVTIEHLNTRRVRRGMHITEATLSDETGKLAAIWFNQPYRADQLRKEKGQWLISGEYGLQGRKYQLTNPSVEKFDGKHVNAGRILPIYRAVAGLKSHVVRKILTELRPAIVMLDEILPPEVVATQKLISRSDALTYLHFPENDEQLEKARKRLGFEELFSLVMAGQLNKLENSKLTGWQIPFDQTHAQEFVAKLPFNLTDAQRSVIWQISQDFEREHPMNRLLQGDVGSGKTVVAGMSATLAALQGYQTAIMAPTEILATQHGETLTKLLQPFNVSVGLLTGSVKPAAKKHLYERIANGEVQIVVGTHALIQEKVKFHKLGFVVIDEQHRFGVAQRQKLLEKSDHLPHLLSMTATPIPRSLALTVYGELDASVLDEMPRGRQPIKTSIVSPNSREAMYEKVELEIKNGSQVYVVCPLIDENPESEKRSVELEYKKLQKTTFKSHKIGLLHGQLSADEKQAVMEQFSAGKIDILVSTTVIEVGVDVPNATVMIIENADQFGLAQAHQLRGRVGRGAHQSYCFLVSTESFKPTRRLRELEKSNDGFYLAEVDLKLRGPGEIYGRAQHGQLNLQMASLADTKSIATAQQAVSQFLQSGKDLLQYKQLANQVSKYQRLTTLN
ncbi:MAG: ATP-dependent DNA helicase RecG [Candidatus Saccharibacteria bacterium]|nr:ATP-dependent DNA helicase RecG [Candidatus Saccharibacteria bacterium]